MQKAKGLYLLVYFLFGAGFLCLNAQETDTEEREYPNKEDNQVCIVCHGGSTFYETSHESGETLLRKMYPSLVIDTVKYYEANHWSFGCLDCHSYDYTEYPHSRELKFEYQATCMDCHDGDDAMEKYNLTQIVEEYDKSHHTSLTDTKYSCWSCHDPHGFKMTVREEDDIAKTVVADNAMCLKCHSGTTATDLLLGTGLEPLMATHEWIPDTEKHFRHVRCIECHGDIVDGLLVAHDILPAKDAVRTCAECHSSDSRLLHSLYLYQIQEGRMKKGFLGGMSTSSNYLIGANRYPVLNWLSLLIFAGILLVVFVHGTIRIIKK